MNQNKFKNKEIIMTIKKNNQMLIVTLLWKTTMPLIKMEIKIMIMQMHKNTII